MYTLTLQLRRKSATNPAPLGPSAAIPAPSQKKYFSFFFHTQKK